MALVKALTLDWFAANIQRGSAAFNNVTSVNVTFATVFALVPKVVATPSTSTTDVLFITNKTTSGFTLNFAHTKTTSVDWIAISP